MLNRHTQKNTLQNARMPLGDVWCLHPDQLLNTNMQHARWFNMTFLIHLASLSLIKLEVPKGHSTVQTDKKDQIQAIWSFRISKHRQFRIQIHGEAMQILPVVSSRSSSCPLNSVWLRRYWCESKLLRLSLSKSENSACDSPRRMESFGEVSHLSSDRDEWFGQLGWCISPDASWEALESPEIPFFVGENLYTLSSRRQNMLPSGNQDFAQ